MSKFTSIEQKKVPHGGLVTLSVAEINAYAAHAAKEYAPGAVRGVEMNLWQDHARATFYIDFVKLAKVQGDELNWLTRSLLQGEKQVVVTTRVTSAHGRARVDVEKVLVGGVVLQGPALELVIDEFVRPRFPEVHIAEWFDMEFGIERVDVRAGGVGVRMK